MAFVTCDMEVIYRDQPRCHWRRYSCAPGTGNTPKPSWPGPTARTSTPHRLPRAHALDVLTAAIVPALRRGI